MIQNGPIFVFIVYEYRIMDYYLIVLVAYLLVFLAGRNLLKPLLDN